MIVFFNTKLHYEYIHSSEMMAMETISTVLSEGRVVVPSLNEANSLYNDGYGSMLEGSLLTLKPFEALYLVERTRIAVVDERRRSNMTFQELLWEFSLTDSLIWTRYVIYRDLRSRGFVVKDGPGLGVDFLIYERGSHGKKPPRYMVYAITEGIPEAIRHLEEILETAKKDERILRIAAMDRRGEIVYYTLSDVGFEDGDEKEI